MVDVVMATAATTGTMMHRGLLASDILVARTLMAHIVLAYVGMAIARTIAAVMHSGLQPNSYGL